MLRNLKRDLARLAEDEPAGQRLRALARGLASPGFSAIVVYRGFRWLREKGIPAQPWRYVVERGIEITTGIQLPVEAEFGPGLRIHHFGGIVVHPQVKAGENCTIYHGVTLGAAHPGGPAPRLGSGVTLGCGSVVLGDVQLDDGLTVGANAVVTRSFPGASCLVGNPARPLARRGDPS